MGHNSVNHTKKNKPKTEKVSAAPRDLSNTIRYAGGDVDGEHVDVTLFNNELTLQLAGHCEVYTDGGTLHRKTSKDDFVITDAKLQARVQELKKLFDKGFEERELKQTCMLALEIEKAAARPWVGNA